MRSGGCACPKIGPVRYAAPETLRWLFEYGGARIKGAHVWRHKDAWRATISFERLRKSKKVPDQNKLQDNARRALDVLYHFARTRFAPDFANYFGPHKGRITAAEVNALLRKQGFDLTVRGFAKLLREAGLNPRQLSIDGKNVQGYVERDIIRAWTGGEWFIYYEPGDP